MESGLKLIFSLVVLYFFVHFRIAGEHERYALVKDGAFKGLYGPGLVFTWLLTPQWGRWARVRLGDRGRLLGVGVALVAGVDLPVEGSGGLAAGAILRAAGFQGSGNDARVIVMADPDQRQSIRCPQCGHEVPLV